MNTAERGLLAVQVLLLWALAFPAMSADERLPDGLVEALSPVEGYVVESRGDHYVVDMGRGDGIVAGDLLAVVGEAKSFTHPVTGETVRGMPGLDSVLRVSRAEEKLALTHRARGAPAPRVGATVRRYAGLEARFLDRTGAGETLYLALRDALPHLAWQGYSRGADDPGSAPLVFELESGRLTVRGSGAGPIHSYALAGGGPAAPPPGERHANVAASPAPAPGSYRAEYSRATPVVSLPGGMRIADFLRRDGQLLMASTDGYRIRVFEITSDGDAAEQGAVDAEGGEVVSVHWWQPEATDRVYLASTGFDGERALGTVYELRDDGLIAVARRAPYIIASFDRDADGRRETLLGQTYERKAFFGSGIHRLSLSGEGLQRQGDAVSFPARFTVQGAAYADLTGDGVPELAFVRDRSLHIYSAEGALLYRSPRQIGGSLSWVHYEVDPELEFSPVNTVPFEISPVAVDLDGDGIRELVVAAADLSLLSLSGAGPSVKRSWLAVFEYRNGNFVKGRLGPERDVPVQGLTAARDAILLVSPTTTSIFGGAEESQIISVPLAR